MNKSQLVLVPGLVFLVSSVFARSQQATNSLSEVVRGGNTTQVRALLQHGAMGYTKSDILLSLRYAAESLNPSIGKSRTYAQSAKSAADYWPMKTGNTWFMRLKMSSGQIRQQVWKVTKVTKNQDSSLATLEIVSHGEVIQSEEVKFTPTRIEHLALGGLSELSSPMPIVQFPLTAGKTWSYSGTTTSLFSGDTIKVTATFTVSGPFQIKLPSGSLQAMRVHSDEIFAGPKSKSHLPMDCWYSSGVGLVQQRYVLNGITSDVTLQSYSLEGKRESKRPPEKKRPRRWNKSIEADADSNSETGGERED